MHLIGLTVSGQNEELLARVFLALENNVPVVQMAEAVQQVIAIYYRRKLVLNEQKPADPFKLKHGWSSEQDGIQFWPTTLYPGTFNFLSFHPSELNSKDLCDYKTSRAYSYYSTGWLN